MGIARANAYFIELLSSKNLIDAFPPCRRVSLVVSTENRGRTVSIAKSQRRPFSLRFVGLRGGEVGSASDQFRSTATSRRLSADRHPQKGMGIALSSTYFMVMGAKCALPTVLMLLVAPETGFTFPNNGYSPQELMSRLLALSTVSIVLGKVVLGPIIDHVGGIMSLKVALLSLGTLLATISVSKSFYTFAFCWILVDFCFSACWAACINGIHQCFSEEEWSSRIGSLAAAARLGNATSFAFFASLLGLCQQSMRQPWRPVFALASVGQLVPLVLLSVFQPRQLASNKRADKSPTATDTLATVRRVVRTIPFWLHLMNRAALTVSASFLMFIPLLMSQVYGATSAVAARTGSAFAMGCWLSVTTIAPMIPKLTPRYKTVLLAVLSAGTMMASIVQLGRMLGWWPLSLTGSMFSLFMWGFSVSVPFYIPASVFALSTGSSATVIDLMDSVAFGLLAVFNGYVAGILHYDPRAWAGTFLLTSICGFVSLVALSTALRLEEQSASHNSRSPNNSVKPR
jgi:MFS family permease